MKKRCNMEFQGGGADGRPTLRGKEKGLKKLGMTLSEVLIAVVIIGCLVILLIPMCKKLQPDKNEALHKKATFIVNKVVNELATDESLYANNEEYTGLSNTNKVTINGEDHEGSTKFCTLFASRLNLAPNSTINCKADEKTLTTNDGMDWYLPISEFKESEYERIKVDVNGSKGPNCSYNESTCKDPDQFIYKIRNTSFFTKRYYSFEFYF